MFEMFIASNPLDQHFNIYLPYVYSTQSQRILNLTQRPHNLSDPLLNLLPYFLIRPPWPQQHLRILDPRPLRRIYGCSILRARDARFGRGLRLRSQPMQRERGVVLALVVEVVDLDDGFGEDVGEGGDAAGGAGGEAADQEVGLAAEGGEGGGGEGGGKAGDFADGAAG